jgi:protocatechuate 3,4-dioxygenase beta subunit
LVLCLAAGVWLINAPSFAAEQAPKDSSGEGSNLGSVEGVVTEGQGGAPVADATIVLGGPGPERTARTDPNGRYKITAVPPGFYALFPRKEGYGSKGMAASARRVRLAAGQRVSGIDFEIHRESVISGRILDIGKKPLSGIRVTCWARSYIQGEWSYLARGQARTNDLGEFRIPALRAGQYLLSAAPPLATLRKRAGRDPMPADPVRRNVRTFYPNGISPGEAVALSLAPGQQMEGLDIVLAERETYCVSGVVAGVGPTGKSSVCVDEVATGWRLTVACGSTVEGEMFEVCGLARGSYEVQATVPTAEGHAARFGKADLIITNRSVDLGRLLMIEGTRIEGELLVAGESKGAPQPAGTSIGLLPMNRYRHMNETPLIRLDRQGSFVVESVFQDDYRVSVQAPRGFYVQRAFCGARDVLQETIRPGCERLTVVLGCDAGAISGGVTDNNNQPVRDAIVILSPESLPETLSGDVVRAAYADQNGRFEFGNLAPGNYRALAFADLEYGEGQDPAFVRRWLSKGAAVKVGPEESKTITLPALRAK